MSSDHLSGSSIGQAVDALRSEAAGTADAGRRFERLLRQACYGRHLGVRGWGDACA